MAESEAIQTAVVQVAIQAATAAVMAPREADTGPTLYTSTANTGEACRHMYGGPTLGQPLFPWKARDRYVEI